MASLNIEILNPKAKKLLQDLADLRLISISEKSSDSFLDTVNKLRSKKAKISLDEITKEVEAVRTKRHGK
jgi:PHD/YefM family antitoxin component YafN of YafNO toxin-antitoxin module